MLKGHCLSYGEGITYWPLRDIVREAAGELTVEQIEELLEGAEDADRIAARVAGAIGIGDSAGAADETLWAVRRLFEHMSRDRPVIVGFDDLQWAEPTFLDLIEYLVGWSRDAPILVVCLARPDLLDKHPTWLTVSRTPRRSRSSRSPSKRRSRCWSVLRVRSRAQPDVLRQDHRGVGGQPAFRRADARHDDRGRGARRGDARRTFTRCSRPASIASSPRSVPQSIERP